MIKNLKEFEKFISGNEFAPSIVDIVGDKAGEELDKILKGVEPGRSWIDIINIIKKKYNITEFQSGMLMGFFMAYQAALQNIQLEVGV